jgi:hypothetical protein
MSCHEPGDLISWISSTDTRRARAGFFLLKVRPKYFFKKIMVEFLFLNLFTIILFHVRTLWLVVSNRIAFVWGGTVDDIFGKYQSKARLFEAEIKAGQQQILHYKLQSCKIIRVDFWATLQMKSWWESNINVWFPFMFSQKWNVQPWVFQNRIIMFCLPIPTLIYLWEIYIFPGLGLSILLQLIMWTDPGNI